MRDEKFERINEQNLVYHAEFLYNSDEGKEMPDIAIESVNFRRAWEYVITGQYDLLADYLAQKVNNLAAGEAEVISLTAATMHIVFDKLTEKAVVPIVSIPKTVCEEKMKEQHGIEAIILGCTELPLLLNSDNCPVKCMDADDVVAWCKTAINFANAVII